MRSEPNQPDGLLAALVPHGVLVQPEVALTRGICWVLGLEGAVGALDDLVRRSGIEPGVNGLWLTEVVGQDGGRTDLEYRWGDPSWTRVVVEAKIGHTLTTEQVGPYRAHLGHDGGLLVVLVPEARRAEGTRVVEALTESTEYPELSADGPIKLAVWTYDDVTAALGQHLPGSGDVAQLNGLVKACGALDIFPMSEEALLDDNPTRRTDVWRVLDAASFGLFGRNLPSGSDWSLEQRRYVDLTPYEIAMAVGVGRKTREEDGKPQPWAWLRVPDRPDHSEITLQVLEELRPGQASRDQGEIWLPLHLTTQAPGSVMIQSIREEIETIGSAVRERVDQAWKVLGTVEPELESSVSAVLGMRPIAPADLLDDSPTRRADIELILDSAVRPFFEGRPNPRVSDDDYLRNRWVRVVPFATHVSTSTSRQTRPAASQPQPWAWLRVSEAAPQAEKAFAALEEVAPGQVVIDGHGRAIPVDIPADQDGPTMLRAVHHQIHQTMVAIRAALTTQHRSDSSNPQA